MNDSLRSWQPRNSGGPSAGAAGISGFRGLCLLPSRAHRLLLLLPLLASAWIAEGCSTADRSDAATSTTPPRQDSRSTASDEATVRDPGTPPGHTLTSSRGAYVITFTPEPQQIPLNELFTLHVQVVDSQRGALVGEDAQLTVDAAMPAHRHGMNTRPVVERTGEGRFLVDGMLFHMPGEWELYFDVTRNGVTERARETVVLD